MKTLVFIVCLFLWFGVVAQDGISLGPHQGRLKAVEKYKVEVVGCNDYLEIYLYTADLEPIHNYNIVGEVKYFYQGETYNRVDLVYYGNDGFTAKISTPGFFYCRVLFDIDGRILTEKFENECIVLNSAK